MSTIKVLTYNVCWGCMVASDKSKFDGTAQPLANKCYDLHTTTGKNVCLLNIAGFIDKECNDYDFIGTQENGNWQELNKASVKLGTMGYVSHLTNNGVVKFVTYYNPDKYILLGGKAGDLLLKKSTEQGRPYQILFFVDKATHKNILFINVHNSHSYGRTRIEENFKNIDIGFMMKKGETSIYLESKYGNDDISSLIHNKKFYIIMTGDFNDFINNTGKESKYWQGLKPFELSNYDNLKNVVISTQNVMPPLTCCDTKRKKKNSDFTYGDYILISDNLKYIKNNTIANINFDNNEYPTSDHLPVYVEVTFNDMEPAKEKSHEKPPAKEKSQVKLPPKEKSHEKPPAKEKSHEKPPAKEKSHEKPPAKEKSHEKPPASMYTEYNPNKINFIHYISA